MPPFPRITDPDILAGYLTDASNTRGAAEALLRPRSAEEAAEMLAWCQARGIPLTVTARRTSTTGGPVPDGGWLLSTELLQRVHALDDVEGGVLLGEHQTRVEAAGAAFPPDPTSRHECSIGAAIACNASGARSFLYGPTRSWVEWLEVVTPTGELLRCDRSTPIPAAWPAPRWAEPAVKTAAGYTPAQNLLDLMIGQEGTLGLITRAGLRLAPAPAGVMSLMAFFEHTAEVVAFVEAARAGAPRARGAPARPGPLQPRSIEYFDGRALELVRARGPALPPRAHHAVWIEAEHGGAPPLDAWWAALDAHGALMDDVLLADDAPGQARLHAVRHAVPAGVNEQVVRNGMPKIGTDFAVPDAALAEVMALYEAVELPAICFGHIGDNHLHLNLLPRTAAELAEARAAYRRLAHAAVALGGTVSAEHGIGRVKKALLADMVGPDVLASFRALKAAVDPAWILGRGALLDPPGP
jgi:FAD/FMN-containing dehydrogenase